MSCQACGCYLHDDEEVVEVACTYVYCRNCCEVTTPALIVALDAAS